MNLKSMLSPMGVVCAMVVGGLAAQAEAGCGCPVNLDYQVTVCCAIDVLGEVDTFGFSGTAGAEVRFSFQPSSLDLRIEVRDDLDNLIFGPANAGHSTAVMLPLTGSYVLKVFDQGADETGSYTMVLWDPANPVDPVAMPFDQAVAGSIDFVGSIDVYSFDATAGEVVRLFVVAGTINNITRIFDPSGTEIAFSQNNFVMQPGPLPQTGSYSVWMYAINPAPVGNYSFLLHKPVDPQFPLALPYEQTQTATLPVPVSMNAHTFEATAGTTARVLIAELDSVLELQWEVYGPDGSVVSGSSSTTLLSFDITRTGTHVLWIRDQQLDDAGSYNIYVQDPVNPIEPLSLLYDQTVDDDLDVAATMDVYSFPATAGDNLRIWTPGTSLNKRIEIYQTGGSLLAGPLTNPGMISLGPFPATGDYHVWIYGATPSPTGAYHLFLHDPAAPLDPSLLTHDVTQSSSLDVPATMNAHQFEGVLGTEVSLTVANFFPNIQPVVEVWDPSGQLFDNGGAVGPLPDDGVYTVWVRDDNGVNTGSYDITVSCSTTGCPCEIDLNGNHTVGIVDFLMLLGAWGTDPPGPPDFDDDGSVGITDFLALLANWGPCP